MSTFSFRQISFRQFVVRHLGVRQKSLYRPFYRRGATFRCQFPCCKITDQEVIMPRSEEVIKTAMGFTYIHHCIGPTAVNPETSL
jgi:hypothetical protein